MILRVSEPDLSANEERYLSEAFQSTQISGVGNFVDSAQRLLQQATGAPHALVTCNGTASLHLALMAVGIEHGDEVIVPSFTYIASVAAILYVGAVPVFVDVQPDTWCLDPELVVKSITSRTRAIMGVHLYGHPFDAIAIEKIALEHELFVIEDAAEAPFSQAFGRIAGTIGNIASFSFFGNKVITCGEGGAVTTKDAELASKMKIIRNQGMNPNVRFQHDLLGNNFRLNNLSASLLCAQLERRVELVKKRQSVVDWYREKLADVAEVRQQPVADWATWTPWLYSVTLSTPNLVSKRSEILRYLAERDIETRPFFIPAHKMKPYRKFVTSPDESKDFAIGNKLSSSGFNLPTSSLMTLDDVNRVVEVLKEALRS